jgi:hypothetical protein
MHTIVTFGLMGLILTSALGCGRDDRITSLESRVDSLEVSRDLIEKYYPFDANWALIDLAPRKKGYVLVRTNFGHLAVSVRNVEPHENGSKITFELGNLASGTVGGLQADVTWSFRRKGEAEQKDRAETRRGVKLQEILPGGSWTESTVVLDGVLPSELTGVSLFEVSAGQLLLDRQGAGTPSVEQRGE